MLVISEFYKQFHVIQPDVGQSPYKPLAQNHLGSSLVTCITNANAIQSGDDILNTTFSQRGKLRYQTSSFTPP